MIKLIFFLIAVFLIATGFGWLADQPDVLLVFEIAGFEVKQQNLAVIAAFIFAAFLAVIFVWIIISMIWKSPGSIGRFFTTRRREKGWRAIAEGVIAVGAGDSAVARRSAKYSKRYLPEEPVTQLLQAQAAQMSGKQHEARKAFETMLETPDTKVLGLRGLYMEAEAGGEEEAARQFVEQAVKAQPGLEWSGKALMSMQASKGDWQGALNTLQQNSDAKLYTKKEAKRLRAVLLTAFATQLENSEPQKAKDKALEAHLLAPELSPAAVIAGRLLARLGDLRKASRVVETAWKRAPHPDLMEVYTHIRAGDSGVDRIKRAELLNGQRAYHPEGVMGIVRAKMAVQDWSGARAALSSLVKSAPTERVCLLMSEIEEGQYGDRGRMREWLKRAVKAPRDPVWTADGYIADDWAPISPISGELDVFEWRVPVENLNEDKDQVFEEIPEGPIEVASLEASTPVSLVPIGNDDNITYLGDKAEAEDATVVEADAEPTDATSSKQESGAAKSGTSAEEGLDPKIETFDGDDFSIENAAAGEKADTVLPDDAGKESGDAVMTSQDSPAVDPITKGQIDDPGPKGENAKSQKRFKLF